MVDHSFDTNNLTKVTSRQIPTSTKAKTKTNNVWMDGHTEAKIELET